MLKRDFFIKACNAGAYKRTAWNIACFSLTRPTAANAVPYPWRISQMPNGYFFFNPETQEYEKIDDAVPGTPLFRRREPIVVKAGEVANIYEDTRTSYANLLANYICLVYAFDGKIPFPSGRWDAETVEKLYVPRYIDAYEPPVGEVFNSSVSSKQEALEAPIYTAEKLRYDEGAFSLVAYTQLFTPADTEKTLTPPPGIEKIRAEEMAKIKGREHDRVAVGQVMASLAKYDSEYLKGDRSSGFLISKKSREIVRMKMYLMYGAETGLDDAVGVRPIVKSLSEGWDLTRIPDYINALRAGSYNRGKQTESGGEAFKDLIRASANLRITSDDCGSVEGIDFNTNNENDLIGFSAIENGTSTRITKDTVGNYLGRALKLRSPGKCWSPKTEYCRTCVGERLAQHPMGLSIAVADTGSAFLAIFLSAAHSKGIQLEELDFHENIS